MRDSLKRITCRILQLIIVWVALIFVANAKLVIVDIGHQESAGGAQSPDKKISEFVFWYNYAGEIKSIIEKSGHTCVLINRSNAPKSEQLKKIMEKEGVVHLNKPDKNAYRYPSKYNNKHIGAGMISADYAIEKKARLVIFLHLNCIGKSWRKSPVPSLLLYNKQQGKRLAESIKNSMLEKIIDKKGGLNNKGKGVKIMTRTKGSLSGAGWLNVLDEKGIPAVIFEGAYVDDAQHVQYLSQDKNAKRLAWVIGEGVVNYLKQSK